MNREQAFTCRLVAATAYKGFLHGLPQPCFELTLNVYLNDFSKVVPETLSLDTLSVPMPGGCVLRFPKGDQKSKQIEQQLLRLKPTLERCHEVLVRVQETAGWPVAASGVVHEVRMLQPYMLSVTICFPSLSPLNLSQAIPWLMSRLGDNRPPPPALSKAPTTLEGVLKSLSKTAPSGTNTRLLLAAAYAQGVPVQKLSGSAMLYGWGCRSRWMDSSFSDAASVISARLARDKVETNRLLRRAGFPVAEQVRVTSVDSAEATARRIGYPVVLKPSNLDGGRGVEAGLMDETSLRSAYERAIKLSKSLILEKHIAGRDYRLGVLNGKLTWATYREPAGVWGDGRLSLNELITLENQDPRRGKHRWSQMVPITINEEARELIIEQGLMMTDVVSKQRFVHLRRAANISSGGKPMDVMDQVHSENAAIAVAVARLFRLDITGIDFITPDITKSWHEVGGAVCEINGQPQFSLSRPDLPGRVIASLVKNRGRIPVIVILGKMASGVWTEEMTCRLRASSVKPGWVLSDGVFSGAESLAKGIGTTFNAVQALLLDTSIAVLLVATDGLDWLKLGMPVDRVDLVICDGSEDVSVAQMLRQSGAKDWWHLPFLKRIHDQPSEDFAAKLMRFILVQNANLYLGLPKK
jgi:cyanophycin synthetase